MSVNEACKLFVNLYHCDNEHHHTQDIPAVTQLVTELGFLPLAIIQAAAYLYENQDEISNYIRMYKETWTSIWNFKPAEADYISVAAVMALSFKKIKVREETVRLFCLITFFAPDNIPELLLTSDAVLEDDILRRVFQNKGDLNRAIGPLCAYSFVKCSPGRQVFSIHRVVQDVMRNLIEGQIVDEANILEKFSPIEASANYWIKRSVEALESVYPASSNPDNWKMCELINPHAFFSIELCWKYHISTYEICSLCNSIGTYESRHGNYQSAEALYLNALSIGEQLCGPDYITTVIHNLGLVYHSQGKYHEAITHYERALRIKENAFRVDHINCADTINNLGTTYDSQGKYDEAIARYERALRIKENAFGVDHINCANTINNLGNTYYTQGKYDEAIAHYERALRIYENAFGEGHINTASTIMNIGIICSSRGKYDEAIAHYERALRIKENAFGVDHINTANMIMNIGLLLKDQGESKKAKEQLWRGYCIFKATLGDIHPKTEKAKRILQNYEEQNEAQTKTKT